IPKLRERKGGGPHVLVFSIHPESEYAMRALRKGAAGYFAKDGAFDELTRAIRVVASGARYLTPEVAERVASEVADSRSETPEEGLSDRELEVMSRIAAGQRSKDIAKAMAVDASTVATFKARVCRKLGLGGTAEIVRYAVERGIGTGK
ncbi:MAG TPA: LuxR C-terminal-related transcriptional regulator, partial [Candidatus Deferrimicrobiaceae bacterium]